MKLKYVTILLLLLLTSCSILGSGSRAKHTSKTIKLKSIGDGTKVGYETDSAVVYFSLAEMKERVDRLLNSNKLDPRWDYRIIAQLKKDKQILDGINHDVVVKHWQNQKSDRDLAEYDLAGFTDQYIFKDFILDGKAKVWNKNLKRFEEKVVYNFVRHSLGTESAYYTFKNGTEFHRQIIALGE
ncbi:hypothetical protein [Pontibacter litorisediminis]|uniref:hypothetical protein n=1 Tax=Pontibacter litorisediminis TaxID=1846260 RepID=UPI0023EBD902|nr:hypothetical protein [Pontibacter litorisediminis]